MKSVKIKWWLLPKFSLLFPQRLEGVIFRRNLSPLSYQILDAFLKCIFFLLILIIFGKSLVSLEWICRNFCIFKSTSPASVESPLQNKETSVFGNLLHPRQLEPLWFTGWLTWWAMIWLKMCNTAVLTSALILPQEEGKVGFIVFYKVGFIGCDRLITSLTLELRWRVKAGDKGIDEEGCNFLCVCVCLSVWEGECAPFFEPGSDSRNPRGGEGGNWTGITASHRCVAVTHAETLPQLLCSRRWRKMWCGTYRRDRAMVYLFFFPSSRWHIITKMELSIKV